MIKTTIQEHVVVERPQVDRYVLTMEEMCGAISTILGIEVAGGTIEIFAKPDHFELIHTHPVGKKDGQP